MDVVKEFDHGDDSTVNQAPEPTQLMLMLEASAGAVERLAAALGAARIASVVIEPTAGRALDAATATPLIAAVQKANAAALIVGDARLASTLDADGVHLPPSETLADAYAEARATLGDRFVVGINAGTSRHDAMSLGEAGAAYVGFGLPHAAEITADAIAEQLELIAWWAEIFEVPCVAFDVASTDAAAALARAGADFVAIRVGAGEAPAETQGRIRAFGDAIASSERAVQELRGSR